MKKWLSVILIALAACAAVYFAFVIAEKPDGTKNEGPAKTTAGAGIDSDSPKETENGHSAPQGGQIGSSSAQDGPAGAPGESVGQNGSSSGQKGSSSALGGSSSGQSGQGAMQTGPGGQAAPDGEAGGNTDLNLGPQHLDEAAVVMPLELRFAQAFGKEKFDTPVGIRNAGDGTGRLFIVEKPGTIAVMKPGSSGYERGVFLDIRGKVRSSGSEQGLLGLAFHPDFAGNGKFYVNYTNRNGDTVIEEYTADPDNPDSAAAGSGRVLLEIGQPFSNHNGGDLAFGPDGYLYIATGDGGSGGDPQGNAQNLKSLLGKILRIDVDRSEGSRPYAIPADNPFRGNSEGIREEIYAYGLRNPWRISFDRTTGELWAADVGQNAREEIDIITSGGNYGWNIMEGSLCYGSSGCDPSGLVPPVWEYEPEGRGASITGGYVYRGNEIPALRGRYIFADFVDGRFFTLLLRKGAEPLFTESDSRIPGITSFGEGEAGELYMTLHDGTVMRILAP